MITIFPKLTDTKTKQYIPINAVLDGIKTGGKNKQLIEEIRATADKEERDRLKKSLPVVLFSGKFSERKEQGLVEYSKFICLDFDHVDVALTKLELTSNPHIYACFTSPSGDGVKALVKVSTDNHNMHVAALIKDFPTVAAKDSKDICRACFFSYDPEIYVNPNAEVYNRMIVPTYTELQKYENLKKWLENKGDKFVNGNRNNFLAKLAGAANRFGIGAEFLKERLAEDYVKGSDFALRELQSVVNGIYTRYADFFDTVSADEVWSDKKVDEVLSTEVDVNDVITVNDIRTDLEDAYDNGLKGGETTHYPDLDLCFRWMRKEITLLLGIANFGKTAMAQQLMVNKMCLEGKKFAVFSPEQAPPVHFYMEFAKTIIGKPIDRNAPDRMTKAEYNRAMDFLHEHIYFVYPEKEEPTPDYIHARFVDTILKYGIDGAVIDPFAALTNDYAARDDKYLEAFLNKSQRFGIQHDIYYWIITHPKNMAKKQDGTFERPDLFDIHNGSTWSKRVDNVLVYHRPSFPVDRSSPLAELTSIKIKKQSLNGLPGSTLFNYDRRRGRFYLNNYCPLDNFKL